VEGGDAGLKGMREDKGAAQGVGVERVWRARLVMAEGTRGGRGVRGPGQRGGMPL
jgi:hypothetical protein